MHGVMDKQSQIQKTLLLARLSKRLVGGGANTEYLYGGTIDKRNMQAKSNRKSQLEVWDVLVWYFGYDMINQGVKK